MQYGYLAWILWSSQRMTKVNDVFVATSEFAMQILKNLVELLTK